MCQENVHPQSKPTQPGFFDDPTIFPPHKTQFCCIPSTNSPPKNRLQATLQDHLFVPPNKISPQKRWITGFYAWNQREASYRGPWAPWKLTVASAKWMLGRHAFPFGKVTFQGRTVKLRGVKENGQVAILKKRFSPFKLFCNVAFFCVSDAWNDDDSTKSGGSPKSSKKGATRSV